MVPPFILQQIRFAVREATAFVGYSFADEDGEVVEQLKSFLTKLGIKCDSGRRAEPRAINDKVRERIQAAELFVGIFTRRDAKADGTFTTSSWTVEEKATALGYGKRLLLFVENGVTEFGGLQGDYEYIPFDRDNLAPALLHAIDYVLSITSVPLSCRVEAPNKLHFHIGGDETPEKQLQDLKRFVEANPKDVPARVSLAKMRGDLEDRPAAISEFRKLASEFPNVADVHHELAHQLESNGELATALLSFQRSLDLNPQNYKNYRCYGKCLHRHALTIQDPTVKKSSMEKSKRLLEQAATIGGQAQEKQIQGDLFVVNETLAEIGTSGGSA